MTSDLEQQKSSKQSKMIVRCPFSPHLPSLYPPIQNKGYRKELTVILLVLALAPDRDALLFEATAFLNPPMTIFDVTSEARFIAAETAGLACDPLDRFAKISGRDWKYLYSKKKGTNYDLSLTSVEVPKGHFLFTHIKGLTHLIKKKRPLSHVLGDSKTPSPTMSSSMSQL